MFVFLVIAGALLFGFGSIVMFTAIPFTTWGTSWEELKEAFFVMIHKRRFQVSLICVIAGFLMMMSVLSPYL